MARSRGERRLRSRVVDSYPVQRAADGSLPRESLRCDNRSGCWANSHQKPATRTGYTEPFLVSISHHERWEPLFFKRTEPTQTPLVPALAWLQQVPDEVEAKTMATIDAVADGPPPLFRGSLRDVAMHREMTGWLEARTKHQKRLYRLFCLQDRKAPGPPGPSLVMVTGGAKPTEAAFSDSFYRNVRRLGDEYLRSDPRSVM